MAKGALLNASVGSYRLIDFVGAGGMGEVYRGLDSAKSRVVALKVLNLAKTAPNAIERFRNEARIHAAVRHPNIATMYEYLELEGAPCIAMEYVDGETIDERIRRRGAVPLEETLKIFERITDAVAYLHRRGIIHRDLKSNNVKVSESGVIKLLDFGIAKAHDSPKLTVSGAMVGTPQYVSPEQLRGAAADERTDIWALGVLLYEMLTARLPFEAESVAAVMDRVGRASYAAPSRLIATLPREVDRIVGLCLKAKPDQRYQTAEALLSDVQSPREKPQHAPLWSLARLRSSGELRVAAARRLPVIAAMTAAGVAFVFLVYAILSPEKRDGSDTTESAIAPAAGGTISPEQSQRPAAGTQLREIVLAVGEGRAEVHGDKGFIAHTPYTVKAALGERVSLVLRRSGYEDEAVNFVVTEALSPRFTYYLRPRLMPPGAPDGLSGQLFSFRVTPAAAAAARGLRHG